MNYSPKPGTINWLKTTRNLRWLTLLAWSAILGISLVWNIKIHFQTIENQARIIARTAFEKDVLYRRWNTNHGGIYALVTPDSQPNPYLKDIPDRDVTTTTGKTLTLINPAYMTRQVFDLQEEDMGVISHITSLKPIRPLNAADEWETGALTAFEKSEKEVSGVIQSKDQSYVRLMRPLMVEERCLKCHATQGYSVGQVRGGISETVPLTPLYNAGQSALVTLVFAHFGIWMVGIAGILLSHGVVGQSVKKQKAAEANLIDQAVHDKLTGLFNRAYFEEIMPQLGDVKYQPVTVLMADIDMLKKTNDEMGHAAGDEIIRRASSVIRESFRFNDAVARYGGDEFVVLMPNTNEDQARIVFNRLRTNLVNHNDLYEGPRVGISFGLATTQPGESIDETLRRADKTMYQEKIRRNAERASSG